MAVSEGRISRVLGFFQDLPVLSSSLPETTSTPSENSFHDWDYESYSVRVKSYSPAFWFAKPNYLSPVQCSLHGWECSGINQTQCSVCQVQLNRHHFRELEKKLSQLLDEKTSKTDVTEDNTNVATTPSRSQEEEEEREVLGSVMRYYPKNESLINATVKEFLCTNHGSCCLWKNRQCPGVFGSIVAPLHYPSFVDRQHDEGSSSGVVVQQDQQYQISKKFLGENPSHWDRRAICGALLRNYQIRLDSFLLRKEKVPLLRETFLKSFSDQISSLDVPYFWKFLFEQRRIGDDSSSRIVEEENRILSNLEYVNKDPFFRSVVLALWGWVAVDSSTEEEESQATVGSQSSESFDLHCLFCQTSISTPKTITSPETPSSPGSSTGSPNRKRRRKCISLDDQGKFDPCGEHRSYCPWGRKLISKKKKKKKRDSLTTVGLQENKGEDPFSIPVIDWLNFPSYCGWAVQYVGLHQSSSTSQDGQTHFDYSKLQIGPQTLKQIQICLGTQAKQKD